MCDRRKRISSRRIDRVVDLTRQCRSDADCVEIDIGSGCRGMCSAWVNQRYTDRIKRWVAYLDQRYCATFGSDGCPTEQIRCGKQRGACVDGMCTGVEVSK